MRTYDYRVGSPDYAYSKYHFKELLFFYKKRTYYLSINSNHPVSELMRMYVKVILGQKRHRSSASKETDHGPVLVHKLAVLGHTSKFPGFFTL